MSRSYGRVGAACACLFLVTGCTLDSFTLSGFGTGKGDGPVVAGSLDVVFSATQKALGDMGLFVSVHRDAETAKLTSTTPDGKRFTLVLKARNTDHGEETVLNIHWEKDADDAFLLRLASVVGTQPKADPDPAWAGPPPLPR